MERAGFVLQQWTDHFDRPLPSSEYLSAGQVVRRIFGVVTSQVLQTTLAQTVDHPF
jgi:hypothetical protein